MDFDTIIAFVFFLVFFVLPSIIKQLQLRKKKQPAPAKKKKRFVLSGIGDQIRQFLKDLEQQAQKQRKAGKQGEGIWDKLSRGEPEHEAHEAGLKPDREIYAQSFQKAESGYKPEAHAAPVTPPEPESLSSR